MKTKHKRNQIILAVFLVLIVAGFIFLPRTFFRSKSDLSVNSVFFQDESQQRIDVTENISDSLTTTLTMMKGSRLPLFSIDKVIDYEIHLTYKNTDYIIYIAPRGGASTVCKEDSTRGYSVKNSDAWRGILYSATKEDTR